MKRGSALCMPKMEGVGSGLRVERIGLVNCLFMSATVVEVKRIQGGGVGHA